MGNLQANCLPASSSVPSSVPPAVRVARQMRQDAKGFRGESSAAGSVERLLTPSTIAPSSPSGRGVRGTEVILVGQAKMGGTSVAAGFVLTSSEDRADGTTGLTMVEGSDDWYSARAVRANEEHTVVVGLRKPGPISRVRLCSFSGGSWENRVEFSAGDGTWVEAAAWGNYGEGKGPFRKPVMVAEDGDGTPFVALGNVEQIRISARFTDGSRGNTVVGCNRGFCAWGYPRLPGFAADGTPLP